jgi:hypothetical protein
MLPTATDIESILLEEVARTGRRLWMMHVIDAY